MIQQQAEAEDRENDRNHAKDGHEASENDECGEPVC